MVKSNFNQVNSGENQKVRVTKEFSFDMGHALVGYDGPCKDIHGHTYHLSVTIIGTPLKQSGAPKDGMVVDFTLIKAVVHERIISRFDHALVLNESLPEEFKKNLDAITGKLVFVPFQPSCENLVLAFRNELQTEFEAQGWDLFSLKLYETPTSYAEWYASDNSF